MSIDYTRDWEALEDEAYEEVVKTKKKPKYFVMSYQKNSMS